jgi:hypothetical protein
MERLVIVPFQCAICRGLFHELEGGRCSMCGKIVCRGHLHASLPAKGYVCSECDWTPREGSA